MESAEGADTTEANAVRTLVISDSAVRLIHNSMLDSARFWYEWTAESVSFGAKPDNYYYEMKC